MRNPSTVIAAVLILQASACSSGAANKQSWSGSDPGAPRSPSVAEARSKLGLTDAQCGAAQGYLSGIQASGLLQPDGFPQAYVKRETWAALKSDVQSAVIWNLATFATCYDGKALHAVYIRDERRATIRTQLVSFDPICHGDHAVSEPNVPWYRC